MKDIFRILGFCFLLTGYVITTMTFMTAYANHDKATLVLINLYSEANFEFVLMLVSIPIVAWYVWDFFRV